MDVVIGLESPTPPPKETHTHRHTHKLHTSFRGKKKNLIQEYKAEHNFLLQIERYGQYCGHVAKGLTF